MKVLMIGNHPSVKGGITSVISQLTEHNWLTDDIQMQFVPSYISANPVSMILYFIKSYVKIRKILMSDDKPDIVHMHMSYRGSFMRKWLIHKMCMKYGVKDIIHLHGSEFQKWYNESSEKMQKKVRIMLQECGAMIVLGEEWKERIKAIEPKTNAFIVSNTVRIPDATTTWNTDCCSVLFLGMLIKRKGASDLLDAIKLLKKQGKLNKIKFLIAGTGEDEKMLINKTVQEGLDKYVEFLGWTAGEKKTDLLKKSQVLILPSYNEGLPIAILEAISYGMPVIATDVGDVSTAVINDYNGVIFTPGDVSAMADAIDKMNNKEIFETYSYNSKKLAVEKFSDEKFFLNLTELYYSITDKKQKL